MELDVAVLQASVDPTLLNDSSLRRGKTQVKQYSKAGVDAT
jgi:hypothetical protein